MAFLASAHRCRTLTTVRRFARGLGDLDGAGNRTRVSFDPLVLFRAGDRTRGRTRGRAGDRAGDRMGDRMGDRTGDRKFTKPLSFDWLDDRGSGERDGGDRDGDGDLPLVAGAARRSIACSTTSESSPLLSKAFGTGVRVS
jgi:hypothetical protein